MSLAKNIEFLRRLPKLPGINGLGDFSGSMRPGADSPLVEITSFGSNPGDLRMFSFVPDRLRHRPALVIVLHGCGQTAAGYDHGSGWSALAQRYGFVLLMPQQQGSNNAQGCFNWFNPEDITRGQGEVVSIRQMIARAVSDHGIDKHRIFITGLSAGGAMTSAMLATYPDVFAGGAIIAGLPFGVAGNVREAFNAMLQSPAHAAGDLGDLVRKASAHKGPWPKLSVWHGSADRTVNPANADEIVKQWLDVHHLPTVPMSEGIVDGYPHRVWWNADGETIVESYTITDMAHGTPLGVAGDEERYGAAGAFLIEAGISSSYHIASFFGLTEGMPQHQELAEPMLAQAHAASQAANRPATAIPMPAPASARAPDLGAVLRPLATLHRKPEPPPEPRQQPSSDPRRRAIDVGAVITRALTAAGLMK